MAKDYYKILGVKETDSTHTIKKAYREAVKRLHPDVKGKAFDKKQFYEIQEAYETLGDEEKRRMYDKAREATAVKRTYPGWAEKIFRPKGGGMEEVFFRREFGWPFRDRDAPEGFVTSHQATLTLTPREATNGGQIILHVPIRKVCAFCGGSGVWGFFACPVCGGRGGVKREMPVRVHIPSGVETGAVLRIPFEDMEGYRHFLLLRVEVDEFA